MSKPAMFGLTRPPRLKQAVQTAAEPAPNKPCSLISCNQQNIWPAQNKGLRKVENAWCYKLGLSAYQSANFVTYLIGLILVIIVTQIATVSSTSPGRKCYSNTTRYT